MHFDELSNEPEHMLIACFLSRLQEVPLSQAVSRQIYLRRVRQGVHVETVSDETQARRVRQTTTFRVSDMRCEVSPELSTEATPVSRSPME
ncbi:hypothetical protein EAI_10068 [Harpegnathos saltator]|uniref:Uncharacterized protein n=1 Tax=Harpegnathos saltator TaxID=610380 RepID=E2BJC9_HARSA|nr:hypothetical protein EAI_10068 [Harpegnathos saltator]